MFGDDINNVKKALFKAIQSRKKELMSEKKDGISIDFTATISKIPYFDILKLFFMPGENIKITKWEELKELNKKLKKEKRSNLENVKDLIEKRFMQEDSSIYKSRTGETAEAIMDFLGLLEEQKEKKFDDQALIEKLKTKIFDKFENLHKQEKNKLVEKSFFGDSTKLKKKVKALSSIHKELEKAKKEKYESFFDDFNEHHNTIDQTTKKDYKISDTSKALTYLNTLKILTDYVIEYSLKLEEKEKKEETTVPKTFQKS